MLFLFCSAATPLYKKDALVSTSYPKGHIFRFRYAQRYVDPGVLNNLESFGNSEGFLVFADTVEESGKADFVFYPVRAISLIRLIRLAGAIYVDFRFGDFVNYGSGKEDQLVWDKALKGLAERPWPPSKKSGRPKDQEGYFLLSANSGVLSITTESQIPFENWNSVVKSLDASNNLAKSTFCLFLGFYQVKKDWCCRPLEVKLESTDDEFDTIYLVPMGQSVVLKLLLSRPSFDHDDSASARTLKITAAGDAFSGISKDQVHSESRYNEDRTVLVCKRVFDNVLSVISIEEPGEATARSPRLTLLTKVEVPTWVMSVVIVGVFLSALFLALDVEVVKFMATFLPDHWKSDVDSNAKGITAIAKALAPIPVAISAYVAFKRLPIK